MLCIVHTALESKVEYTIKYFSLAKKRDKGVQEGTGDGPLVSYNKYFYYYFFLILDSLIPLSKQSILFTLLITLLYVVWLAVLFYTIRLIVSVPSVVMMK